ncbi:MAG TPA: peptidase C69 [Rhodospirillales bacterium]|nr:peptidase C69 [Rhodospirillales bacterium]
MCDTFLALPSATRDGSVIFAKNSDRPAGEGQSTRSYTSAKNEAEKVLKCTYIEIPEVEQTDAVLLSQIDWMWGAEMGANECGVIIGNEAVWTNLQVGPPALLGMDLVRLGLERGATARQALDIMVSLLEEFGQGGPCAENDPGFAYDNAFLITDAHEAWVLDTAKRLWVAKRLTGTVMNISNRLSIRDDYDLCHHDLINEARKLGHACDGGSVDFTACFSTASVDPEPGSREEWGARLMAQNEGAITPEVMMDILRHHDSGICMHGGFETTASMVSQITPGGTATHWLADGPNPCRAAFQRVEDMKYSELIKA